MSENFLLTLLSRSFFLTYHEFDDMVMQLHTTVVVRILVDSICNRFNCRRGARVKWRVVYQQLSVKGYGNNF